MSTTVVPVMGWSVDADLLRRWIGGLVQYFVSRRKVHIAHVHRH